MIGPLVLVMALGGIIPVYLISKLLDWGVFGRFMEMQEIAVVISTVLAVLLSIGLYGFGHANGGTWNPGWGTIAYFISGVIVLVLRLRWYSHYQDNPPADPHLSDMQDTFE